MSMRAHAVEHARRICGSHCSAHAYGRTDVLTQMRLAYQRNNSASVTRATQTASEPIGIDSAATCRGCAADRKATKEAP